MENDLKAFVMQDVSVQGYAVSLYIKVGFFEEEPESLGVARILKHTFWRLGNKKGEADNWESIRSKYSIFPEEDLGGSYMSFTARFDDGGLGDVLYQMANAFTDPYCDEYLLEAAEEDLEMLYSRQRGRNVEFRMVLAK